MNWLKQIFRAKKDKPVQLRAKDARLQADMDDLMADVPRYPPYDTGIPFKPVKLIVRSQADLVTRIQRAAGTSREDFQNHYLPIIENLAKFVHLLPATPKSNHCGAGGLYRMCLELALFSLQGASVGVFPSTGAVERRQAMMPKWGLATFIAGGCSQLYRVVNNMVVLDKKNQQWTPMLKSLEDWAKEVDADVYFIRWLEEKVNPAAQSSSAYLVNSIVPAHVLHFLSHDNNQVIPAMSAAITGSAAGIADNPISRIVAPTTTRVIDEDLKRSSTNYGNLSVGVHIEPYLIDAMRRLMKVGTWAVNACGKREGRIWLGNDGVFLDWQLAAGDIVGLLYRDAFAGIPQDPETLAELLCESGVLERMPNRSKYWALNLPESMDLREGFVKLRHREILFPSSFDFKPYETLVFLPTSKPIGSLKPKTPKPETVTPKPSAPATLSVMENERPVEAWRAPEPPEVRDAPEAPQDEDPVGPQTEKKAPEAPPPEKPRPPQQGKDKKPRTAPLPLDEGDTEKPSTAKAQPEPPAESESADRLLKTLQKENAWLMRQIISAYRSGKSRGTLVFLEQGVGISHDELSSHGQNAMGFLDDLSAKNWLWIDKTKPTRKMHPYEQDGRPMRLLIIKSDIAKGLGLEG